VPADIDGTWELSGLLNLDKTTIRLIQKKQFFDGTINLQGRPQVTLENGRIQGSAVQFDFVVNDKKHSFKGQVNGSQLNGVLNGDSKLIVTGRRL
jgi:hypothetical protein